MFGKKKQAGPPSTPTTAAELGTYPQVGTLGYCTDDELFTIQGKVDKQTTDLRKVEEQKIEQWSEVIQRPASQQCIFFLNAFWPYMKTDVAERFYNEWKVFKIIQKESGVFAEDSPSVNGALALLFMQRLKRGLTKTDFDAEFKNIDSNFDGAMAFGEYLCWDQKKSPAEVMYRPQRYSQTIARCITRVIAAERAMKEYNYAFEKIKTAVDAGANIVVPEKNATNAAEVEAAMKALFSANKAKNELEQFKKKTDLKGLNAEAASAKEALSKAFLAAKEEGTAFWEAQVAKESNSLLSQKQQAALNK